MADLDATIGVPAVVNLADIIYRLGASHIAVFHDRVVIVFPHQNDDYTENLFGNSARDLFFALVGSWPFLCAS